MVQILAAENTANTAINPDPQVRLTIAGSNFVTGHRYLVLWRAVLSGDATRATVTLRTNGVIGENVFTNGESHIEAGKLAVVEGMWVWDTATNGHDLDLEVNEDINGVFGVDEQLMAIDLDDGLIPGIDWWYDQSESDLNESPSSVFHKLKRPAELLFTPDGTSNYMVVCHTRWWKRASNRRQERWRLRDVTNGSTLFDGGYGNAPTPETLHSYRGLAVMQAPSAQPTQLNLEFRATDLNRCEKRTASIFVLRLSRFVSSGFLSADIAAQPVGPTGSLESVGSFQYTPDSTGEVALIGCFNSEVTPNTVSGIVGEIQYAGAEVSGVPSRDGTKVHASLDQTTFGKADTFVGPNLSTLLTGQSGTETVEGFIEPEGTLADLNLRQMTIVAFGTELNPLPASFAGNFQRILGWNKQELSSLDDNYSQRLAFNRYQLVVGNWYLVLWRTVFSGNDERTEGALRIGDIGGTNQVGTVRSSSNDRLTVVEGVHILKGATDVDHYTNSEDLNSGLSDGLDEQLLLINLDSSAPGVFDGLIENLDWWWSTPTGVEGTPVAAFGPLGSPARITFTPDGVSDYIVFSTCRYFKDVSDGPDQRQERWRIQDTTNGVTLADGGYGNSSNDATDETHRYRGVGVMVIPAAVSTTVEIQYRATSIAIETPKRADSDLFILRLSAFKNRGYLQADVGAQPVGPLDALESIGSFQYTPDAVGKVALLSSFMSEVTPDVDSGIVGEIQYGGAEVSGVPSRGARTHAPLDQGGLTSADTFVGPNLTAVLEGRAGAVTVEGFVEPSGVLADLNLRRQVLVAFGTELGPPVDLRMEARGNYNDSLNTSGSSLARANVSMPSATTYRGRRICFHREIVGNSDAFHQVRFEGPRLAFEPTMETRYLTPPVNPELKHSARMRLLTWNRAQLDFPQADGHFGKVSGVDTARAHGTQVLNLELDTNGLQENTDWFYAQNDVVDAMPNTFGAGGEEASVTFTPDGTSTYVVFGSILTQSNNGSETELVRLQDVTNAVELDIAGMGNGDNGLERHGYVLMAVLSAPAATARTIELQYLTDGASTIDKSNAEIFILRLSAFANWAVFDSDLNSVPTGAIESIGSMALTPAASGELVLFGKFSVNATPGFESGRGYQFARIAEDIDGGGFATTSDYNTPSGFIAPSAQGARTKDDVHLPFNTFQVRTGLSGTVTYRGEVQSTTPTSEVQLRKMSMVAFTPELAPPPPPPIDQGPTMTVGIIEGLTGAIGESDSDIGGLRSTRLTTVATVGAAAITVQTTLDWPLIGTMSIEGVKYAYTGTTLTTITGITHVAAGLTVVGVKKQHNPDTDVVDLSRTFNDMDKLRAAMLVDFAEAEDLNTLGRNLAVLRLPFLSDDEIFRDVIKALAYNPRGTVYGLELALDALVGAGNYEIIEDLIGEPNTVRILLTTAGLLEAVSQGKAFLSGFEDILFAGLAGTLATDPVSVISVLRKLTEVITDTTTAKPSAQSVVEYTGDGGTQIWTYAGVSEAADVILTASSHIAITFSGGATALYNMYATNGPRIDPGDPFQTSLLFRVPAGSSLAAADGRRSGMIVDDGVTSIAWGIQDSTANPGVGFDIDFMDSSTGAHDGGVSAAGLDLARDVYHTAVMERDQYGTVTLTINGVLASTVPSSVFAAGGTRAISFGGLDSAAGFGSILDIKEVAVDIDPQREYWSELDDGSVATANPTRVTATNASSFVAGDVGKTLNTITDGSVTNAESGTNEGKWEIDTFLSDTAVTVKGFDQTATGVVDNADIFEVPSDVEAFLFPRDLGKTIVITGSALGNDGSYVIDTMYVPGTVTVLNPASYAGPGEKTNKIGLAGATFTAESLLDWRADPTFVTESDVTMDYELSDAGTLSGVITTLRQAAAGSQVMRVNYALMLSAQLLEDENVTNLLISEVPLLFEYYPFYITDPLGFIRQYLDEITAAGVIPEFETS